jgi:alcohol dehydrogenase
MRTRAAVLERSGEPRPYAGSAPLVVCEVELAEPGPRELLVRVEAAGVCHSDLSVVDGNRPRPLPMVLGHEAAGVVEAVGPGVPDVAAGDHVVLTFMPSCGACPDCVEGRPALCADAQRANGAGTLVGGARRFRRDGAELHHHLGVSAFAERTVVARASAVVVPPELPFDTAALFGCAMLTGAGAVLNSAGVRPGESVAVFGLGGVGLAAVMGAVVVEASPILAVDPVESKRELALELGATGAFRPEDAVAAIRDATGGGARHAIEAAGHAGVLRAAYDATRPGGTTVSVGLPHPSAELVLPALSLVAEARTLVGSYLGSCVPQRDVARLVELWRAGRLPVERLQAGRLPLSAVNEAMDALADGGVVRQILVPGLEA